MRHLRFIPAFLTTILFVFILASCSNSSSDPSVPSQTVIQNNVQSDSWKITYFNDSGKDETNHFTGYTFTFGANGTLTASASSTQTGSWSLTDSNSNDDSVSTLDFNIQFSLGNDLDDLSEDWSIVSQTSSRIELIHVSGGNGGTDYLTFEKK